MTALDFRRAELAANLDQIRQRIAVACGKAGRNPAEVVVIAVTKYFPFSDVTLLAELGISDIGENRDNQARERALRAPQLRWHFLGQLQRNKCRSVVRYANMVHSVDRPDLVRALGRAADQLRSNPLDILLQINLDPVNLELAAFNGALRSDHDLSMDPTRRRAGVSPSEVESLVAVTQEFAMLRLRGVMGITPRYGSAEPAFSQLRSVSRQVQELHPPAKWISAGMSDDLEAAIAAGATHVRVGTALLGISLTG
ncbi:MAG: YggS family pyridoxal phosphate-dependent enzyme [Acidimicrobiales bacterium]|nr:MAG: YggS family pyridoxal phosphate-dependent enzyme [Acidimicrobiales bacterium]